MSLEQSIATATNEVGRARDEILNFATVAQEQIARVTDAYASTISNFTAIFHVNETTGLDTGSGLAGDPLRTIQEAVSRTPRGSRISVRLATDITLRENVVLDQRELDIRSDTSGVRRDFSFERKLNTNTTPNQRFLANFIFTGSSGIYFQDINLKIPAIDGNFGDFVPNSAANIFVAFSNTPFTANIAFGLCDIEFPPVPFAPMIGNTPCNLKIGSTTFSGSNRFGNIHGGFTNPAGTPINDAAHLIMSNQTTI